MSEQLYIVTSEKGKHLSVPLPHDEALEFASEYGFPFKLKLHIPIKVVIFEDACTTIQEWDEFSEEHIKEYVGWDERTEEGDDQHTTIDWVNDNIASIPFCEGPHFIFIKQ